MKRKIFFVFFLICVTLFGILWWNSPYRPFRVKKSLLLNDPSVVKLNRILDDYKEQDLQVIYDGMTHPPQDFLIRARGYLARNFKPGDEAQGWIEKHCYRTRAGQVIYFQYPDGKMRPVRDVFLEELKRPD